MNKDKHVLTMRVQHGDICFTGSFETTFAKSWSAEDAMPCYLRQGINISDSKVLVKEGNLTGLQAAGRLLISFFLRLPSMWVLKLEHSL